MMDVYRISPCRYNSDLSGTGAAMYGGRWNSKGVYVVYTSSTPSLALLESVVHLPAIPREKYCLATIKIPEDKILEIKEKRFATGLGCLSGPGYFESNRRSVYS